MSKALEGLKFCRAFAKGECKLSAEECLKQRGFSHLSKQQLIKMFGFDPFKTQSGGGQSGDEGGKQGKGGKAKAKAKAKSKAGKALAAAESGDEATSAAAELQRLKSKQLACAAFQKGQCKKGDQCIFAHVEADVAAELKRANAAWKKNEAAKRSASSERAAQ